MLQDKTALVIDRSNEARDYVASILRQQFHCRAILQAQDQDQAQRVLGAGTEHVDWVFYDADLAGQGAPAFLRQVRARPGAASINVIAMTRHDRKGALQSLLDAGADDYLVKPFTRAILLLKVQRLGGERRSAARAFFHARPRLGITFADGAWLDATPINASPDGCLLRTAIFEGHAAEIYANAIVTLQTKDGPLPLQGTLVRVERDVGDPPSRHHVRAAFQFDGLTPEARRRLAQFIADLGLPHPGDLP